MGRKDRQERIENALWGLFIGDALAMPAHWFYSVESLEKQFDGGLRGYEAAPHPHPESFMVGMEYLPDVEEAKRRGRDYDILGKHARFYRTSYSELAIETGERESQHGNESPAESERYHYHHGLKAGENTLGAELARMLVRSMNAEDSYSEASFLKDFIALMLRPDERSDPYTEIYLRSWFENYVDGLPATACAGRQRENWSIGSMGGLIRPLIVSLLAPSAYEGIGLAAEHMALTHRSELNVSALSVLVPLLAGILAGRDPVRLACACCAQLTVPEVTGDELFKTYRDADGPGNLPDDKVWRLHMAHRSEPFDLQSLAETPSSAVVNKRYATACYPEHGLPLLLYFAARHDFDLEKALLANANAGGDNVHRGAILGLLLGAATETIPEHLKAGLLHRDHLEKEIVGFADLACRGDAFL